MMALHTSTILARTPAAILAHISRLPASYAAHPLLFTLSANAPELQTLVSRLTTFSTHTTGCLSAPLGEPDGGLIACSLAVFDSGEAVQFRSTIEGRAAPQVGRWHAFRERGEAPRGMEGFGEGFGNRSGEGVNWEEVWDRSAGGDVLPSELQALSPDDVRSIVFLSDGAPEGLSNALSSFPRATKLGLLASSTPFITGRPVTLFHNGHVHSSGAVGLALTGPRAPPQIQRSFVEFPGLRAITPPVTVTRSEGNLVNTLDDGNPSRLLLAAIQKHGIEGVGLASFKDAEFYLGAFRGDTLSQVYRITSGDPSRGTIALESHVAPTAGTMVRIYHRANTPSSTAVPSQYTSLHPHSPSRTETQTLAFLASAADMPPTPSAPDEGVGAEEVGTILRDVFLGASENGFVVSRSWDAHAGEGEQETDSEVVWKCTVAGGVGGLEWTI